MRHFSLRSLLSAPQAVQPAARLQAPYSPPFLPGNLPNATDSKQNPNSGGQLGFPGLAINEGSMRVCGMTGPAVRQYRARTSIARKRSSVNKLTCIPRKGKRAFAVAWPLGDCIGQVAVALASFTPSTVLNRLLCTHLYRNAPAQNENSLSFESSLIKRTRHNRYQVPDWIHQQVYLNPYRKELMLRNHV